MNFKLLFFAFPLFFSCGQNNDHCKTHSEQEIKAIERMLDLNFAYDEGKWVQASAYDQLIQYYAHDSWGQYEHIIRLYKVNQQNTIELMSKMKKAPDWKSHSIRHKIVLEPDDIEGLWSKAALLFCKEVYLEPDASSIDGDDFELFIKDGLHQQGFKWQYMRDHIRNGRIASYKDTVVEIVGDLMLLCNFPNGEKFIDLDRLKSTRDTMSYSIYLGYAFNVLNYRVYLDDKLLSQGPEGQAKVKVAVADTNNLRQRIRIKAKLLDNSQIEL